MILRNINLKGKTVSYNLSVKNVKNINLRIKSDGSVNVSANRFVPVQKIEEFMQSKADFILNAIEKYSNMPPVELTPYYTESKLCNLILSMCRNAYPYYQKYAIPYPEIKFKKLTSRWGSCHPSKGILTFSTNLVYAPPECVEYVVLHEFTHFLQANHSPKFYSELEKVCPDWKIKRKFLREINIK